MGRHSNGTKNYRVAGWMWMVLVAIVLIIALVIGWGALHTSNQASRDQKQCPEGNYDLTVWTSPERMEEAQGLADQYNDAHQVVNDHCVNAQITPVSDADAVNRAMGHKNVSSVWIPTHPGNVAKALKSIDIDPATKDVPVANNAAVFALSNVEGLDEQAARAGSDFSDFIAGTDGARSVSPEDVRAGNFGSDVESSVPPESGWTVNGAEDNADSASKEATDVTFVLDTSGSMGLYEGDNTRMDNIRKPLADAMVGVGKAGGSVGLWNYSSPQSSGVTSPFRTNVDVAAGDDGSTASALVNQLSYGGATYTYESVLAAYQSAVANAETSKSPNARLVLITDGPNDGGSQSLDSAIAAIKELHGQEAVQLDVVTIGDNVDTDAMEQLASAGGGSVHKAADSLNFEEPLKAAVTG